MHVLEFGVRLRGLIIIIHSSNKSKIDQISLVHFSPFIFIILYFITFFNWPLWFGLNGNVLITIIYKLHSKD